MRLLITGATGFIGQACCAYLEQQDIAYTTCGRQASALCMPCDILHTEDLTRVISTLRPTHILHLAWYTGKNYGSSAENLRWLAASKDLIQLFTQYGGRRFVGVGTCFEYPLHGELCTEEEKLSPDFTPHTLYGESKRDLRQYLQKYAQQQGISWAWCHPFYVFGAQESPSKLIPSACTAFAKGENFATAAYYRSMDYIDVRDAAKYIIGVLLSDFCGRVNIGTGKLVTVQTLLEGLANLFSASVQALPKESLDTLPPICAHVDRVRSICGEMSLISAHETLQGYYARYI